MEKAILTNYGTGKAFSTPIVLSNEKYSLGRGLQNDFVFDDVSISRNHCTIEKSGKEWIVIDRSSNGTLVNGNLLGRLKAHVLQDSDVITLGSNLQIQFVKRNNTPGPVNEANKSSLSEAKIMNIADAIISEVEGPKLQLSQSIQNEFNIPMDVEGNSNNDILRANENNSSVQPGSVDIESSCMLQPPHSEKSTVDMTSSLDVPKTTVISINPGSCYISKGSLVINSTAKPKTFTLSSLSEPIFFHNTLPGASTTTSTASTSIPSWLIGVVSHKLSQQSQRSKSSITKTIPKRDKSKTSVSPPTKTYSNTKKSSKKKSTTEETSQPSCSKSPLQATDDSKSVVEDLKEKVPKEETEPKPGCSKSSETNLHTVEDELQCSICTEMFIKAVTLSCSHTFCKFCIDEWKRKKTACPICRAPIRSILPTLVIDNFIEKILENADEETKIQRSKLMADREAQQPSGSKDYRSKEKSDIQDGAVVSHDAIVLSSDSDTNSYDSDLDNMSYYDDDSDYGYVPYNGLPGVYYGGYGYCYRCGERGHWVRGCPNV